MVDYTESEVTSIGSRGGVDRGRRVELDIGKDEFELVVIFEGVQVLGYEVD